MKILTHFLILLVTFLISLPIASKEQPGIFVLNPEVPLVPDYPAHYVVAPGDDVISVLGRFVLDPLLASSLWGNNSLPDIQPGDVITLLQSENQNMLQIKRGRTVKLSPMVRVIPEKEAIPTIPIEKVQQFLNRPQVITEEEVEETGYIIGNANNSLLAATGNLIYAREVYDWGEDDDKFLIIRMGQPYIDPQTEEVLIFEAIYLGEAIVKQYGDPATLEIESARREIQVGDRLLPLGTRDFQEDFYPHVPTYLENTQVIAVVDGVSQIGQYQIVVINRGRENGIERGHVLAVNSGGKLIRDPITGEEILLPSQQAGTLLVFKVFDQVAYALVMKAQRAINLLDKVTIP